MTVLVIILLALLVLVLLAGLAGARYFLVLLPRRWKEPYRSALVLLADEDARRDGLEQAERLLGEALNAGPRGAVLNRIRFAQAYTRAMLGPYEPSQYAAAAAVLVELIAAEGRTGDCAYLELWLQARLENHLRVTDLYQEQHALLEGRPSSRRIAAISHLHLAVGHWRRRELDRAEAHFDRVRELGELTDQIPPEAENLQLAKGVQAVFDGRADEARTAFEAARDRARQVELSDLEAELGLLVCAWPDGQPNALDYWLLRLANQADTAPAANGENGEDERLSAGIALLRLVVLLRGRMDEPPLSGAPSLEWFEEFERRAQVLRDADPELGDPDLVEGLIRYYFALNQPEREAALSVLERGAKLGDAGALPEVLDLIERERAVGGEGDGISRYLTLLGEFLEDPERSEEDRSLLRRIRERFARYGEAVDAGEKLPQPRDPGDGHQRRVEALRRRIELIVYPRIRNLPADHPAVLGLHDLLAELDRAAGVAADGAGVLQKAELDLVMSTAQTLLPEEDDVRDES